MQTCGLFSDSITLVGAVRLLVARCRLARSYKRDTLPTLIGVGRVNPGGIDPIEAPVAQHA